MVGKSDHEVVEPDHRGTLAPMGRTYGDACGVARALDRVGERWALMVVRELLLGPKRFTDVRAGLPGVSADVLAQRLRELEEAGVVHKRKLPPPAAAQVYELTEWGRELEAVVLALGRWGARACAPPEDACMSLDAHVLSLQTLFRPERAEGLTATMALRFGEERFVVEVAGGRCTAGRGEPAAPDVVVTGDPGAFLAVVHGRAELAPTLAAGAMTIEGPPAVAERLLGLFPLPEPALA